MRDAIAIGLQFFNSISLVIFKKKKKKTQLLLTAADPSVTLFFSDVPTCDSWLSQVTMWCRLDVKNQELTFSWGGGGGGGGVRFLFTSTTSGQNSASQFLVTSTLRGQNSVMTEMLLICSDHFRRCL